MSKDKNSLSVIEFEDLINNVGRVLTKEEKAEIAKAYAEIKNKGKAQAKLIREIVPIREWLESDYYLGRERHNIYPYWKKMIIDIFEREEHEKINQVIITGSIGTGKTTVSALLLLRRLYELSCYENIHSMFKLMAVSPIAFAYLSVTKDQAENSGFSTLKAWLDDIPYFKEYFPRRAGLESLVIFPQENMLITFGSVANHFIGMNVIGSVLDEANFFEGRQVDTANQNMNTKVSALYSQMLNRSLSRFVVNGINHSMNVLVSSTTVESSFTEEMINKARDDKHTYVANPTQWDVKPNEFSKEKFPVFVGGAGLDPHIINTASDLNIILEVQEYPPMQGTDLIEMYKDLPGEIQQQILLIPESVRQAFQGDIIIALQDLAGYSVSSSGRFFNNEVAYAKAIDPELKHPFSHENIVLSTADSSLMEGFMPIYAYLKPGFKFKNPKAPRYMHLDLALVNDSVGISMAHVSGWRNLYNREDDPGNENYMEAISKVPEITVDFMLEIKPPNRPHTVSFGKIREFIVYLSREMGINFKKITADQYQSAQLLQELDDLGFDAGLMSVDRSTKAYDTLANLLYENRIKMYDYPKFKHELFHLVKYPAKNKVDHTAHNSKDVSDSVAGSVFNAIESKDKSNLVTEDLFDLFISANQGEASMEDKKEDATKRALEALGLGGYRIVK